MQDKIPIFTNLDPKRRMVRSRSVTQLSEHPYKPKIGDVIKFPPEKYQELVKVLVNEGFIPDPRNHDQFITVEISDVLLKVVRNNLPDWFLIRRVKESPDVYTKYLLWSISNHFVTSLCDIDFAQFLCGRKIRITGYDGTYYSYDIIG